MFKLSQKIIGPKNRRRKRCQKREGEPATEESQAVGDSRVNKETPREMKLVSRVAN